MKKNLTHAVVTALKKPAAGQVDYWDTRKPGFGIRVSNGGTKSWHVMYRQHGRKRRLSLGQFPELSAADARSKATAYLGDIAKGMDPAEERTQAKLDPTFGEFADIYLERYARVEKKPRSVREDEHMIEADLKPAWQDRKLPTISRRDVIALLDRIVARDAPVRANRVRALASKMFNFAISRDLVEHNPVHGTSRPSPERSRERRLSDDEICTLTEALKPEPLKVAGALKLALLTAARRSEILGLPWSELDLERAWWTLPGERTKNGKEHRIPLSPTAVILLRELEADADAKSSKRPKAKHREGGEAPTKSQFVFAGGRIGRPVANPQKWMKRIRDRAELQDIRFHDLRRTAASGMTAIGIERLTVSKLLNHAEGGVTQIYDRHSYDVEKRAAVNKWDRRLNEILSGKPVAKVVALHG